MSETFQRGGGAVASVLATAMDADARIVLLGEEVRHSGSTAGLVERFGAERVRETPVADRATVAMAVGMAFGGARPVVHLSSTSRLLAVLEVLSEGLSAARESDFEVPIVIRVPWGGEAGDRIDRPAASVLASLGIRVVAPSSPAAAASLLRAALATSHDEPVVILESRSVLYAPASDDNIAMDLDRAVLVRDGGDVTLAGWGDAVAVAQDAAEQLAREGISAGVVDLVSLCPIDTETLGSLVRASGRLVVVDADAELAGRAIAAATDAAFLYLESPPLRSEPVVQDVVETAFRSVNY